MSQIKHRQRLAARYAGVPTNFRPQGQVSRITGDAPRTKQPQAQEAPGSTFDAAQTAHAIAALPPVDYTATLEELAATNPQFYDAVVVELNRMNEETKEEGDGFDLNQASINEMIQQENSRAQQTIEEANQQQVTDDPPAPEDPLPTPRDLAEALAALDEANYAAKLAEIEQADPELYQLVTEELVNMQAEDIQQSPEEPQPPAAQ